LFHQDDGLSQDEFGQLLDLFDLQAQTGKTSQASSPSNRDNSRLRLLQVGSSTTGVNIGLESMTLMADERLDEEIAINQCGRWLKEQCDFELWALTRRMAILFEHDPIADMANPAFPQVFAQALMEALGKAVFGSDMRQVFKAFRPVLDIVPAVYHGANDYLRRARYRRSQHFAGRLSLPAGGDGPRRRGNQRRQSDLSVAATADAPSTVNHTSTPRPTTPELARTRSCRYCATATPRPGATTWRARSRARPTRPMRRDQPTAPCTISARPCRKSSMPSSRSSLMS
jgi:hypothetical protein